MSLRSLITQIELTLLGWERTSPQAAEWRICRVQWNQTLASCTNAMPQPAHCSYFKHSPMTKSSSTAFFLCPTFTIWQMIHKTALLKEIRMNRYSKFKIMHTWVLCTLSFTNCNIMQCSNFQLCFHDVLFANVWCYISYCKPCHLLRAAICYVKFKKKKHFKCSVRKLDFKRRSHPSGKALRWSRSGNSQSVLMLQNNTWTQF